VLKQKEGVTEGLLLFCFFIQKSNFNNHQSSIKPRDKSVLLGYLISD